MQKILSVFLFLTIFTLSACVHNAPNTDTTTTAAPTLDGIACTRDSFKNFRLTASQVEDPRKLKGVIADLQKNYPHIGAYFEQPLAETQWIKPLKDLGFVIHTAVADKEIATWLFRNGRDIPEFSRTTHGAITAIYCPKTKRFLFVFETAKDFWTVPGGGVGPGELASHTAAKEVLEEAGITLPSTPRLIAVLSRTSKDEKLGYINGIAQIFFATIPEEMGKPDGQETAKVKWVSLAEIESGKIDGYPVNSLVLGLVHLMKSAAPRGTYIPIRPRSKEAEVVILANFKDLGVS